jgi:chitosanase
MMCGDMNGTDSPGDQTGPAHRRPSVATSHRSSGPARRPRHRGPLVAVLVLVGVVAAGAVVVALGVVPGAARTAQPAGPGGAGHGQDDSRRVADQIVSVFENGDPEVRYDYVDDLDDGRGYTAGRAGFCTACGDLVKVVQPYTDRVPGNPLAPFLPELKRLAAQHSDDVGGLDGFQDAWVKAAADPAFRETQDHLVDELYFRPAAELARQSGVGTPLGLLVLYDTAIQNGISGEPEGMAGMAKRTTEVVGGTPGTGVDEMRWLRAFLGIRRDVLLHPADPTTAEVWRASVGRVDALGRLIDQGQTQLQPPITINPFGRPQTIN